MIRTNRRLIWGTSPYTGEQRVNIGQKVGIHLDLIVLYKPTPVKRNLEIIRAITGETVASVTDWGYTDISC